MGVRVHLGRLDAFGKAGYGLLVKTGLIGEGTNTQIDDNGLAVTKDGVERVRVGALGGGDYGLRVTNAGATVIIDGSSNMFKIAATGTQDTGLIVDPGTATASTTLTGLGALATTPAHISLFANGTGNGVNRHLGAFQTAPWTDFWGASAASGAANKKGLGLRCWGEGHTSLDGSAQAVVRVTGWASGSGNMTFYQKFYVLVEAAL